MAQRVERGIRANPERGKNTSEDFFLILPDLKPYRSSYRVKCVL